MPAEEAQPTSRRVTDEWIETLAQVLESMSEQRPEVSSHSQTVAAAEAGFPTGPDVLWWEQHFQFSPDAVVWVAAPRSTWQYAGALTLKAAGVETPEATEIRKTWLKILGQWLSGLASSLRSVLGTDIECIAGAETPPPAEPREWTSLEMRFAEQRLEPLIVFFSAALLQILDAPPARPPGLGATTAIRVDPVSVESQKTPAFSPTLDLLLDVELPVSLSFGKTQLPLKDVLKLTSGSIVELNRGVNEPVEVLVNHCLIARGEVVVVDGNYAVRIQQIASRQDRLRSIR